MSHESYERKEKVKAGSNRNFGLTFAAVFFILGAGPLLFGHSLRVWALIISFVFALVSFLRPQILLKPKMYWLKFGLFLHAIISPVILAILFYGVFLPMGLLLRLFGKDILKLSLQPQAGSYWIKSEKPLSTMRDQF